MCPAEGAPPSPLGHAERGHDTGSEEFKRLSIVAPRFPASPRLCPVSDGQSASFSATTCHLSVVISRIVLELVLTQCSGRKALSKTGDKLAMSSSCGK